MLFVNGHINTILSGNASKFQPWHKEWKTMDKRFRQILIYVAFVFGICFVVDSLEYFVKSTAWEHLQGVDLLRAYKQAKSEGQADGWGAIDQWNADTMAIAYRDQMEEVPVMKEVTQAGFRKGGFFLIFSLLSMAISELVSDSKAKKWSLFTGGVVISFLYQFLVVKILGGNAAGTYYISIGVLLSLCFVALDEKHQTIKAWAIVATLAALIQSASSELVASEYIARAVMGKSFYFGLDYLASFVPALTIACFLGAFRQFMNRIATSNQ